MFKLHCALVILLICINSISGEKLNCNGEPVQIDLNFIECCEGKPSFVSQSCLEALSNNNTFTEECIVDCLYKDFKLYDGEKIDLQAVKKFFDANVTIPLVRSMFINAFEYCTKIDQPKLREMFAFAELVDNNGCDLYPAYLDQCIWYHTLGYCPEDFANTSEQCTAKMQWARECLLK